jgi:hypothetical protein
MREVLRFPLTECMPDAAAVLRSQSLPEPGHFSNKVRRVLDQALSMYADLARPGAVIEELTRDEFDRVHADAGPMPQASAVGRVYPRAQALALFAATLGERVSLEIRDLFAVGEVALGYMLDTVASVAADRLPDLASARFRDVLGPRGSGENRVLAYSPGYCGWPTRGQGALFARLRPDEVGIALNDSFLMWPLKSVSGVLVAAPLSAHAFDADFPFCDACATHECRARLAAAAEPPRGGWPWSS